MKKNNYNLKIKILIIFFVLVLCVNNFSAVVSDNDGSAFITKSEFDSLKNNFQSQLDSFNSTIDNKIDSAIASYLAGITMDKTYTEIRDRSFDWTFPIICMNNSEWNSVTSKYYDYEMPDIKTVEFVLRGWGNNAKYLSWTATTPLLTDSSSKATGGCVCFCKSWHECPVKYNEIINISDNYVNVTVGTTTFKAYEILNVGKGRHVTEDFNYYSYRDAGHAQSTVTYWGYTGVLGIGVNGANAKRSVITSSTFANWSESTWTRTGGTPLHSELGWGGQHTYAFVLPANNLDLNGAKDWGARYTSNIDSVHGQGNMVGQGDSSTRENSFDWQAGNNIRQWVYTGNSDAPATSVYGWSFDMKKPQSASEKFAGYIMNYMNDIGMTTVVDGTFYGFHSWTPKWYWRYKASGTVGTAPSNSQFSRLPAKQVYYKDNYNNIHFFDEGLFLFNLRDTATKVDFTAKWDKIDTSLPSGQKVRLKISYEPFNSVHDSSKNLKYKVNDANDYIADQQVDVGSTLKISVECNDNTKQLYMMWEPVTSGAYIGLSEISDFLVTKEGK